MVSGLIFEGAIMLYLFAAVFDLRQSERGRGAFEKVAKLAELFQVFRSTREKSRLLGSLVSCQRRCLLEQRRGQEGDW